MKQKILISALAAFIALSTFSCKKKEKFLEPDYIFSKWVKAVKALNYTDYKSCEAFPKNRAVFREMYRDRYFVDLMVTDTDEADEAKTDKDLNGRPFIKRNVRFECEEVNRRSRKPLHLLRGDVDFVRYINEPEKKRGWLMWNRKIIRIKR